MPTPSQLPAAPSAPPLSPLSPLAPLSQLSPLAPLAPLAPLPRTLGAALQARLDTKTKPVGSLGRLEDLACQVGRIQGRVDPAIRDPHLVVFAGDHGAAAAGISAYPQEVTWQMVENFLAGGAAINVLARRQGLALTVVDVGVAHDFGGDRPGLVDAKVAPGTASYLHGPAMTGDTCRLAIERGAAIVRGIAAAGGDLVGLGEMGIGNTAAASLLIHGLTGASLDTCVGRGTGLDDAGLARKRALLTQAWAGYRGGGDPLALLAHFGGLEIAALVGAIHAGAATGMVVLIDGAIVTAAALVAERLAPGVAERCVFCHRSTEPAHTLALDALGATPLLDLRLRLGEGTGAALAYPLVAAAIDLLRDMASFHEANVSTSNP